MDEESFLFGVAPLFQSSNFTFLLYVRGRVIVVRTSAFGTFCAHPRDVCPIEMRTDLETICEIEVELVTSEVE